MIKLVYCIRRRDDIPPEAFYRYWRGEHAELVTRLRTAIGACRYVQSHSVQPEMNAALRAARAMPQAYDGITEVWWDSIDTLQAAMGTAEGQAAMQQLVEDEARFIDQSRSCIFMTEEHRIFD